jgi:glutamine amidotransferase
MRVTIFDYGAGNLHSLSKAIANEGTELRVEDDPTEAVKTDLLVLPGVGAFTTAAERLGSGRTAMRDALLAGLPCLGICLGMQLLMDESEEGPGSGLGVIMGKVRKLRTKRIPQIGWNEIASERDPVFEKAPLGVAYFANSFVCDPSDESSVIAWSTHENDRFPAAVRRENVVGVQFHPEKSSAAGLAFVRAFIEQARP